MMDPILLTVIVLCACIYVYAIVNRICKCAEERSKNKALGGALEKMGVKYFDNLKKDTDETIKIIKKGDDK